MTTLEDTVLAICESAAWKLVPPDSSGHHVFIFDNSLSMELFSPDGRLCIFAGDITTLPTDEPEATQLLDEFGRRAVAAMRTSACTVSLDEKRNTLCLYRSLPFISFSAHEAPEIMEDFLNDLVWWKQQADTMQTSTNAFSFFSLMR